MEIAAGVIAAVLASGLFSAGIVLQGGEARTVSAAHALHLSLIGELLRRRRWVLGGVLMSVGFVLHVGALSVAPLTVVQPALAAGLLVLLVMGARSDGDPIRPRELASVTAIAIGVAGLAFTSPERSTNAVGTLSLVLGLGVLLAVAVLPSVLARLEPRRRRSEALLPAFAAGAAYALCALTTKFVSDGLAGEYWVSAAAWLLATMLGGALALLDQTSALQGGRTTQVGVIIYVTPVVVPVVLAPLLVGESWASSPGGGVPLALSILAVCLGAAALGGSRRIRAQEAGGPGATAGVRASARR